MEKSKLTNQKQSNFLFAFFPWPTEMPLGLLALHVLIRTSAALVDSVSCQLRCVSEVVHIVRMQGGLFSWCDS